MVHGAVPVRPPALEARDGRRQGNRQHPRVVPTLTEGLVPLLPREAGEGVGEQLWEVVGLRVAQGHDVGPSPAALPQEVLLDLAEGGGLVPAVVLPVVPHVDVRLGPDHAIRDAVLLKLALQGDLRLSEATGRHDDDGVEVAQTHAGDVGVQREQRCPHAREVPEAHAPLVREGVHRGRQRGLVDSHGRPAGGTGRHPTEPIDQQGLAHAGVAHDAHVHRAL
mmetsp:Transcript_142559/g.443355  ORF Transcript_142559/g.443355 Transcript_142559/m.443355 type:complete len:222 (-) Transcript_142559:602-1267(-)